MNTGQWPGESVNRCYGKCQSVLRMVFTHTLTQQSAFANRDYYDAGDDGQEGIPAQAKAEASGGTLPRPCHPNSLTPTKET
mmetsp:Transcript_145324/g.253615  ORF Transcript_145324/g.253615 Transcript_145324/m.253615 type:complete len:81 (-) Transcript_145324:96-338(-)